MPKKKRTNKINRTKNKVVRKNLKRKSKKTRRRRSNRNIKRTRGKNYKKQTGGSDNPVDSNEVKYIIGKYELNTFSRDPVPIGTKKSLGDIEEGLKNGEYTLNTQYKIKPTDPWKRIGRIPHFMKFLLINENIQTGGAQARGGARGGADHKCFNAHYADIYLDSLKIGDLIQPGRVTCFCRKCYPGGGYYGAPREGGRKILPLGWTRYGLNIDKIFEGRRHVDAAFVKEKLDTWEQSYHGTSGIGAQSIIKEGRLMQPGDFLIDGTELKSSKRGVLKAEPVVFTSPTIKYAGLKLYSEPAQIDRDIFASIVIECIQPINDRAAEEALRAELALLRVQDLMARLLLAGVDRADLEYARHELNVNQALVELIVMTETVVKRGAETMLFRPINPHHIQRRAEQIARREIPAVPPLGSRYKSWDDILLREILQNPTIDPNLLESRIRDASVNFVLPIGICIRIYGPDDVKYISPVDGGTVIQLARNYEVRLGKARARRLEILKTEARALEQAAKREEAKTEEAKTEAVDRPSIRVRSDSDPRFNGLYIYGGDAANRRGTGQSYPFYCRPDHGEEACQSLEDIGKCEGMHLFRPLFTQDKSEAIPSWSLSEGIITFENISAAYLESSSLTPPIGTHSWQISGPEGQWIEGDISLTSNLWLGDAHAGGGRAAHAGGGRAAQRAPQRAPQRAAPRGGGLFDDAPRGGGRAPQRAPQRAAPRGGGGGRAAAGGSPAADFLLGTEVMIDSGTEGLKADQRWAMVDRVTAEGLLHVSYEVGGQRRKKVLTLEELVNLGEGDFELL